MYLFSLWTCIDIEFFSTQSYHGH